MRDLVRPETVRQSLVAAFDACPLSARFNLESKQQGGPLAARGILFHRFAAGALNYMRSTGETEIPAAKAMEILARVVAQHEAPTSSGGWEPVGDGETVHVPMKELKWLRVLATKWAYQNTFSIANVVEVERQLHADIEVIGPNGLKYTRRLTGRPDVLLAGPAADEATVIDWKSGFAAPPDKRDAADGEEAKPEKLSDMGYVQQIVYGYLALVNFPVLNKVTEREVYVFHDEVREATVYREDMERIEDVLATQVALIDAAITAGPDSQRWVAIPGSHCGYCPRKRDCPIRDEVGIPDTPEEAQRLAGEWHVAGELRKERLPYLKGWVDACGPIQIAHSKGRREVGWVANKTGSGRSFKLYEPGDAPESPFDPLLEDAARTAGVLADA